MLRHHFQRTFLLVLVISSIAGVGCGGTGRTGDGDDPPDGCSDSDRDGHGVGAACAGPDCDDWNPDVQADAECATLCDTDPRSTGCPCGGGEPVPCYTGPEGTENVGPCIGALRNCEDGVWQPCRDQVLPEAETCDEEDDDCDGTVDDGVSNPCGSCGECDEVLVGTGDGAAPWNLENANGLVVNADGDLTLDGSTVSLHVIWVANSLDGTISKIDTRDREEVARYRTGPLGSSVGLFDGPGDNPSRTSVSYLGDAYIANRAFTGVASATKIYGSDCPDRNADGRVETSEGPDDVLDWDEDECIAWNTSLGDFASLGRSIVVEGRVGFDGALEEFVWFGLFNTQQFHELDANDGSPTGVVVNVGSTPYGAAIDRDSNLWCATLDIFVCRFTTTDPEDVELIEEDLGAFNYGITVDADGNVWTGGDGVSKFDVKTRTWQEALVESKGIAADAAGWIWTHDETGVMTRIAQDDPTDITLIQGFPGRGVAVDSEGLIWFVNWGQREDSDGDISVIDPDDLPASAAEIDLCCETINNSYTYSDMTGFQLRNATNPRGTVDVVFEPCDGGVSTRWTGLRWEGSTPAGTSLHFQARTGATLDALISAGWVDVATQPDDVSPASLTDVLGDAQDASYLMVRTALVTEGRESAPTLRVLAAQRACGLGVD